MINLFSHNLTAYESAVKMLQETGKAAIIHPTGTGKSFIAFKLCEDNEDRRVLWLSPSEYIFKTQVENLKAVSNGYCPNNIIFYTYAKLMYMSEDEIALIKPDYIILDEFHRCGAEVWGKGVQSVLNAFSTVPVLGLSATNIRYLDNQRDMADELFDGNVASSMTLGEAIVRGILLPPKYVTAVYKYCEELKKYEKRIAARKSKIVRDKAELYLEKLRRALEKADGLEEIFYKHTENRNGKYIVFCSDYESLNELQSQSQKMFGQVNDNMHVYSVYSNDPETDKAFKAFKVDNSDALRLLYCIDMLNEGIHMDDVDGVILFRPTISPIIYKQQIGRALSASKGKNPVIFDIVNNFDNLYSVGALKEEMLQAVVFYRATGENELIVNERFRIIDELRECREIFAQIENILAVPWNTMYAAAKRYYKQHGDLLPLATYMTEEGYSLGQWVVTQRTNKRNNNPVLTQERIAKLDKIGMVWFTAHERYWEENYVEAKAYYETHGNLNIPRGESQRLNSWIIRQRQRYKSGEITKEQYDRLSAIGMVWELPESFEVGYAYAKAYFEHYGNLDIPVCYVTKDGYSLGHWYRGIRDKYRGNRLSSDEYSRLQAIGFESESVIVRNWMKYYELAKAYFTEHGDLNINANYETSDGTKLGVWISGQRYGYGKGRLKREQIDLLEKIGMSWHRDKSRWETGYVCAEEYYGQHGTLNPTIEYVTDDGFALGCWVATQRNKYRTGKLNKTQIERLELLGMRWNVSQAFWEQGYAYAAEFYAIYGHLNVVSTYVSPDEFKLGTWVANQRTKYKKRALSIEQIAKLEAVGMVWYPSDENWQRAYESARDYYLTNGHLAIPQKYRTPDGFYLGCWLNEQRKAFKIGKLTDRKIELLMQIGFTAGKETTGTIIVNNGKAVVSA